MNKNRFLKGALGRTVAFLLMLVMMMSIFVVSASAEPISKAPYDSYTYWTAPGTKWSVSATPMYEYSDTITSAGLGLSALKDPSDIFTDTKGNVYIMDSGNGRLIVTNPDFTLKTVISDIPYGDEVLSFMGAQGLFVTTDGKIYIADTENARVIVTNLEKEVLDVLVLPDEDVIPESFNYRPAKVAVNSEGFTYILSDGSYYGAILYKPDGSFSGFYGSNSVEGSILGVFAKIYEMIFVNDEKKMNEEKSLPYSFTDIAIDEKDFIYTATGAVSITTSNQGQLKKLSPGGTNVLKNKTKTTVSSAEGTNFSDGVGVKYAQPAGGYAWRVTNVGSMDVDKYGYMYGLCKTYGHILVYDQECNQIGVFGGGVGAGEQKGIFTRPIAIHVNDLNQDVLVLDTIALNVTVFKETEYGALIKKAQDLTTGGYYVEAKPYWEKALSQDRNQQLAYRGLARAALIEEDYETTLHYAKLGYDQDTYASAFVYVRNDYLTRNFVWIFGLAVLLIVGLILYFSYAKKHELQLIKNQKVKTMFSSVVHPFEGAQQVRYYGQGSARLATGVLVLFFLTTVILEIYEGFMYNMFDKSSYSAAFSLIRTFGLVLLWSVVNWAMSTLFQGKGKMKEVYIVTCYALIPLIINNVLQTLLSNVLTPEEALVISAINVVCIALAGIMLCVGVMTVHEYGFFKLLAMTVVVILAMLVAIFVILMMYVLIQQFIDFILTIYKEVTYR